MSSLGHTPWKCQLREREVLFKLKGVLKNLKMQVGRRMKPVRLWGHDKESGI